MIGAARLLVLVTLVVCSGPRAAVRIVEPADGATVTGPAVRVVLAAEGVEIAPVADGRAGTGHHHLFLDVDPSPPGAPIPAGPGVVHLGGGQTEHTFEGVEPGPHRLITLLGDLQHVPWDPPAADTVMISVTDH